MGKSIYLANSRRWQHRFRCARSKWCGNARFQYGSAAGGDVLRARNRFAKRNCTPERQYCPARLVHALHCEQFGSSLTGHLRSTWTKPTTGLCNNGESRESDGDAGKQHQLYGDGDGTERVWGKHEFGGKRVADGSGSEFQSGHGNGDGNEHADGDDECEHAGGEFDADDHGDEREFESQQSGDVGGRDGRRNGYAGWKFHDTDGDPEFDESGDGGLGALGDDDGE